MQHELWYFMRRAAFMVVVAALAGAAFAGCDDDFDLAPLPGKPVIVGSFHIIGEGMYEAFDRWLTSLTEDERAVIEELIRQEDDLLIHVFLATGRLPAKSRGGESAPALAPEIKQICDFHPIVGRFAPKRNWDVAYDSERTKRFEEVHRISTPLRECAALEIENQYRRRIKLPEVPRELMKCPSP